MSLCWHRYRDAWWPSLKYNSVKEALVEAKKANLKPTSLAILFTREQRSSENTPVVRILGIEKYGECKEPKNFFDYLLEYSMDPAESEEKLGKELGQLYQKAVDQIQLYVAEEEEHEDDHDEEMEEGTDEFPLKNQSTSFETLISELDMLGWNIRADGYYIRPGKTTSSGVKGRDYFTSADELQDYCKKVYGWSLDVDSAEDDKDQEDASQRQREHKEDIRTPDVKTKPQDPGAPLYSSDVSLDSQASDPYEWNVLWPRLSRAGWSYTNAWNILDSFYYLNKNVDAKWCRKNGKEGIDFFKTQDDIIEYCKKEYKRDSSPSLSKQSIPIRGKNLFDVSKKRPAKNSNSRNKKAKVNRSSISPKMREEATERKNPSRSSRAASSRSITPRPPPKSPEHWWKRANVPDEDLLLPILESIGVSHKDIKGEYTSPFSKVVTESFTGLISLLARIGIPESTTSSLKTKQLDLLDRALRFANVPSKSQQVLRKVSSFNDFTDFCWFLNQNFRWEFSGGRLYIPNSDEKARSWGAVSRKPLLHYFDDKHYNELRVYIRDIWDPLSHLDEEYLQDKKYEYLRVRLHGAASSMPRQGSSQAQYPWAKELDEEEIENFSTMEDMEDRFSFNNLRNTNLNRTITPDEKQSKKKAPRKDLKWYQVKDLLTESEAWQLLTSVGFFKKGGSYAHSKIKQTFDSVQSIRVYLVKHGIPNLASIEKGNDRADFEDWIKFAHVPHPNNATAAFLADVPVLSILQFRMILAKLGFVVIDSKCYPPGHNHCGTRDWKHKVHFWYLPSEINEFLRENESFYIGDLVEAWSVDGCNVKEQDLLALRVQAATADIPLPEFCAEVSGKDDEKEKQCSTGVAEEVEDEEEGSKQNIFKKNRDHIEAMLNDDDLSDEDSASELEEEDNNQEDSSNNASDEVDKDDAGDDDPHRESNEEYESADDFGDDIGPPLTQKPTEETAGTDEESLGEAALSIAASSPDHSYSSSVGGILGYLTQFNC